MFDKFTEEAKKIVSLARLESQRFNHDYIGTEHVLLGLIKLDSSIASQVLQNLGVDIDRVMFELEKIIEPGSNVVSRGEIPFTPGTKHVFEAGLDEMRNFGHVYIGTEHLLLGLLKNEDCEAAQILANLEVCYDDTRKEIITLLDDSENEGGKTKAEPTSKKKGKKNSKTPALDAFGKDLTEMAKNGELDPVIGREKEIKRMLRILCRRRKNNAVLIGEAGVGKTAVVEGFSQMIVNGNVPARLKEKRIIILDLALMVAGTKYRGQFEERLKTVVAEVQRNKNIVLFIDEIHTMVGAGAAEGSIDASNILKPALSRGEIQCIGATTLDEYRKYFEKDAALERRFQSIIIEPPDTKEAVKILHGLKETYEKFHGVEFTSEALEKAVELSDRYISGRHLPDKAIDVLDESAAGLCLDETEINDPEIDKLDVEKSAILVRKQDAIVAEAFEDAAKCRDEELKINEKIQKIVDKVREKQGKFVVDVDVIAEAISVMTGIPNTRLGSDEAKKLLRMEDELRDNVVSQTEAIEAISKAIRRSSAGIRNPNRPMGSFMFVGPTGVGKTYLCKMLAEFLFDDRDAVIQVDMSEYMEKHNVSKLIGAPPGYVGFEEGGQLTERVRKKPYSVILFDEIEKAHGDVMNILLQILEEGHATDSFGRKINFKNTIIILTSNVGSELYKSGTSVGFRSEDERQIFTDVKKKLMVKVNKKFRPEFLNRLDKVVVFSPLGKDDLKDIIHIELRGLVGRLAEKDIALTVGDTALEYLIEKGYNPEMGARPLRRAVETYLEDELSEEMLKGNLESIKEVIANKNAKDDKLTFKYVKRPKRKTKAKKSAKHGKS